MNILEISRLKNKNASQSNWIERIKSFRGNINQKVLLKSVLMIFAFLILLGVVQFSTPNVPGNDGFYHIKMAYLMRTEGIKPDFPWLPLTILNAREFYNHHFLFHILLIPFTFGDLILGAKLAVVVFAALAFWMVWYLLDKQFVPYSAVWALGLMAVSEAFISRMSIPRAQTLSLGLLALALHWLLIGKYKRLMVLGFIYVWLYNAFPLLLLVAGAYILSIWLVEKRLELHPLLYATIGIAAGLLINPYLPYNLAFIFQHILPKVLNTTEISVGNEWYPYTTQQLLNNSPLALAMFISAVLALGLSNRRMRVNTATGFLLATAFGLMTFQSRRFIEYFPAFALIFTAFAWTPIIAKFNDKIKMNTGVHSGIWRGKWAKHLPLMVLIVVLLALGWKTVRDSQESAQNAKPYQLFEGTSEWLISNTPAGERVFQTDWDDFPRLFFYNTHNTYLVGLDPTYMQIYDADLYAVWVDITRGQVENPSGIIEKNFGASFILSDLRHERFINQATNDPRIIEVYRDEEAVIFQVVDE